MTYKSSVMRSCSIWYYFYNSASLIRVCHIRLIVKRPNVDLDGLCPSLKSRPQYSISCRIILTTERRIVTDLISLHISVDTTSKSMDIHNRTDGLIYAVSSTITYAYAKCAHVISSIFARYQSQFYILFFARET